MSIMLNSDKTRVIITTTNTVNGMLEEGGVCGRRISYDIGAAAKSIGMTVDDLIDQIEIDDDSDTWLAPAYDGLTVRDAIEAECIGKILARGTEIQ